MSDQTQQTPGWGPPPTTPPPPTPPKPKRQHLIGKIAVGVAAGIALFIVGSIVLVAVLIGGGTTSDKQAAPTPTALPASAFPGSDTTPNQFTPDSTPADETPQTPEAGKVGDTFTATADDGSAAEVTVTKITTMYGTIDYQSAEHGMFLVIYVKVAGTAQSFDINPLDFYVTGADGTHYEDPTYAGTVGTPALDSGTLHAGEHTRGTLVYDVNPKAKHGKFAYSPNLDGEPIATWSY